MLHLAPTAPRSTSRLAAGLALGLLLLATACASTREAKVRTALRDAGLSEPMARCMSEPLGRDLSVSQLRSLQRVARLAETRPTRLTERQVLDLLRRDLDPETVGVVVRAGVGCFLRG